MGAVVSILVRLTCIHLGFRGQRIIRNEKEVCETIEMDYILIVPEMKNMDEIQRQIKEDYADHSKYTSSLELMETFPEESETEDDSDSEHDHDGRGFVPSKKPRIHRFRRI